MDTTADNEGIGFIPNYWKVLGHLQKEWFALADFKIHGSKVGVKIPKRFSISEQPDKTIRSLRILYTIGKSREWSSKKKVC